MAFCKTHLVQTTIAQIYAVDIHEANNCTDESTRYAVSSFHKETTFLRFKLQLPEPIEHKYRLCVVYTPVSALGTNEQDQLYEPGTESGVSAKNTLSTRRNHPNCSERRKSFSNRDQTQRTRAHYAAAGADSRLGTATYVVGTIQRTQSRPYEARSI